MLFYIGTKVRITLNFFSEIKQAERQWNEMHKTMMNKGPGAFHPPFLLEMLIGILLFQPGVLAMCAVKSAQLNLSLLKSASIMH